MAETDDSKKRPFIPWFYWTRLLGSGLILFGLLLDHTEERSTIILTGAGLLGIDKVARGDSKQQ
jgi:hypothetical protein